MNWIEILGAIGFGSFITTVLNIFWLPKIMEKIERRKWLRDNQLRAFSKLSREILSFRLGKGVLDYDNPFEFYSIAAESMLLIEDSEIKSRINNFIINLDDIFHLNEAGEEIPNSEYNEITTESRVIIDSLSSLLIKNKQKDWIKRLFKR